MGASIRTVLGMQRELFSGNGDLIRRIKQCWRPGDILIVVYLQTVKRSSLAEGVEGNVGLNDRMLNDNVIFFLHVDIVDILISSCELIHLYLCLCSVASARIRLGYISQQGFLTAFFIPHQDQL
ncbi:hypothetical protein ABKN59_010101 [Abortiporus biennis]